MDHFFSVLAYHKIDLQKEWGINSISPKRFERQIEFLKKEGYECLSPKFLNVSNEDLCFSYNNCSVESKKPILITFDDGYEGIYYYAYPILKKYEFSAIIFLSTGYIGRYNSWDASPGPRFKHLSWYQVKEMANDGFIFGSHGVSHSFLTRQNNRIIEHETKTSKSELEDKLGIPIHLFSYPYGDYNSRIIDIVKEAGYVSAFSLKPDFVKSKSVDNYNFFLNTEIINKYALPRFAIYFTDSIFSFKIKIQCKENLYFTALQLTNQIINRCSYASLWVKSRKDN
ncbi:MAG: polysaccharide deacetylase family protein [bacterium]